MRKRIHLIILFISVILISSCSKEKNPANNDHRVKSYTEEISTSGGSFSMTYNLSYDGEKRITGITPAVSNEGRIAFTYHSKDKFSMDLYNSGEVEIHQDIFLRNSLLDSTVQYNTSKDTMSEKYVYNATNQLTGKAEYEHTSGRPYLVNSIQYNYDAAGNMINSSEKNGIVETFTYYSDLVYAMPVIAPYFNQLGKTQLIKSYQRSHGGNVLENSVTTYTFDSKDRIETVVETTSDGTVLTKSFTYF